MAKSISDTARERLANLKKTGGAQKSTTPAGKPLMSQDAKNIKVRQQAEKIPEAEIKRGKF